MKKLAIIAFIGVAGCTPAGDVLGAVSFTAAVIELIN
jgi:hypothetical protein